MLPIPLSRARRSRFHAPSRDWSLALLQGQSVEVSYADEDSKEPAAWWEARIVSKKGPYCKVHFLCGSFPDEAVEDEKIRPATVCTAKPMYSKQTVQLPNEKTHAFFLQNEVKVMGDVREKAQLLAATVEKSRAQIKLIGATKSIAMAKMLLDLHMKNHGDLHRIQNEREQLVTKIEMRRAARENGIRVEFAIAKELIGLVVGKGGKQITDVKKATGVEMIEVDQTGPRVIIIGPTQEAVDAARESLEFIIERVPVEPEQVGWLIGRGGKNFRELQEKTKVTRLNVDKSSNHVILVGTVTAVAAAQLYIDTHLDYLAEYDKEKAEAERLQMQLSALTVSEQSGKGKGKGGGGKGTTGGKGNGGIRTSRSAPAPAEPECVPTGGGKGRGKGKDSGGSCGRTSDVSPPSVGRSEPASAEGGAANGRAPGGRKPREPKAPADNGGGADGVAKLAGDALKPSKRAGLKVVVAPKGTVLDEALPQRAAKGKGWHGTGGGGGSGGEGGGGRGRGRGKDNGDAGKSTA